MDAAARQKLIEQARLVAQRGDVDDAVKRLLAAGALDEAARTYAEVGRMLDAGHVYLAAIGRPPEDAGKLDPERQKAAAKAARLLAKGGDTQTAVTILLALGDSLAAAEILERAGDGLGAERLRAEALRKKHAAPAGVAAASAAANAASGREQHGRGAQKLEQDGKLDAALVAYVQLKDYANAGRIAYGLGRHVEAGQLYLDAGRPYQAGRSFHKGGETGRSLDAYVRVTRDDPQYRDACVRAIELAARLNVLEYGLDHLVERLIHTGPTDDAECAAFARLSRLYSTHDFPENAREVLQKLMTARPDYPGAVEELARLDANMRGSAVGVAHVVREDAAFRGAGAPRVARGTAPPLVGLPDLPDLPPLEAKAQPTAPLGSGPPPPMSDVRQTRNIGAAPAGPGAASGTVRIPGMTAPQPPASAGPDGPEQMAIAYALNSGQSLPAGTMIGERYRIVREIGRGGMAAVYRANDLELDDDVALKFIFGTAASAEQLTRFKRELLLARKLSHPNIVQVYDIGTFAGCKFISMELMTGADMMCRIEQGADALTCIDWLLQICAGLGLAHDNGVVHRDIKPDNFFVTDTNLVKVMDFGIAKQVTAPGVTKTGFIAGTPHYIAPEQISDFGKVTHLADLYALGVVAYRMFAGRVPFDAEEMMPLLMLHMTQAPTPPSQHAPGLLPELDEIVLKLMQKQPDRRYQSCKELSDHLQRLRRRLLR